MSDQPFPWPQHCLHWSFLALQPSTTEAFLLPRWHVHIHYHTPLSRPYYSQWDLLKRPFQNVCIYVFSPRPCAIGPSRPSLMVLSLISVFQPQYSINTFPCTRHYSNKPILYKVLFLFSIGSTERASNLLRVAQLVNARQSWDSSPASLAPRVQAFPACTVLSLLLDPTPFLRDFALGVLSLWDALLSPFSCPISISSPSEPASIYLLELPTSWSRYFCYLSKVLVDCFAFLVDCKLHGGRPAHPVYSQIFHAWHTAAYLVCLLFWWMKHGSQWSTHAEFFSYPET